MSEQEPLTEEVGEGVYQLTPEGRAYMEPRVTDMESDIFAFTQEANQLAVSASMARYSRSKNGAKELYANEFSGEESRDSNLIERVTQDYGDESVEQLFNLNIAAENVSMLLSKQLEWPRPGIAYLEKSTRYMRYDVKDMAGRYKYVHPNEMGSSHNSLKDETEAAEYYENTMDTIFDNYSRTVEELTSYTRELYPRDDETSVKAWEGATRATALDVARELLPASAKTNVGIHASAQAINNLVMRLAATELSEARRAGDKILEEAREITPAFFKRTDRPDRGKALSAEMAINKANMEQLAQQHLPHKPTEVTEGQTVELRRYSPEDEFELLPYMLFDVAPASYSIEDIKDAVANLDHEEKVEIFNAYTGVQRNRRAKPGRAIEQANYTWEVVSDFGAFRDLQRHRLVDDLRWQPLTVEHGFDIPEYAKQAGLESLFQETIDASERLYEYLTQSGRPVEAQYATLLGHKIRWTVKTNGRSNNHIFQLRSTPQAHPSYRETVQRMYREVERVHPYLARLSMKAMNLENEPAVGRLEQERKAEDKKRNTRQ